MMRFFYLQKKGTNHGPKLIFEGLIFIFILGFRCFRYFFMQKKHGMYVYEKDTKKHILCNMICEKQN